MDNLKSIFKNKFVQLALTLIGGLFLGWLLFGGTSQNTEVHSHESMEETGQTWTCSMHPQINMPEPGKCPLCGMDLIPKSEASAEDNPIQLQMTANAVKLAQIETTVVGEAENTENNTLTFNGYLKEDERRKYIQTAHFSGRIESLAVNFEGDKVSKGQTIATVYSPELVSAQKELLESLKMYGDQNNLVEAARQKLRKWKLSEAQIAAIEKDGNIIENFPIKADYNGTVQKLNVALGDYIKVGQNMMQLNDLSQLWIYFEVYEDDLPLVKIGRTIDFEVNGLTSETFTTKIDFIEPNLDANNRVALIRGNVSSRQGTLKPAMYVKGELPVGTQLATSTTSLAVPRSAVMWTGERSLVYVAIKDADVPTFEAREVVLGLALGDIYQVKKGLEKGEAVVTNGTFTIDAAAQLNNKASMMNKDILVKSKEKTSAPSINFEIPDLSSLVTPTLNEATNNLLDTYLALKDALVNAKFDEALVQSKKMLSNLDSNISLEDTKAQTYWNGKKSNIIDLTQKINSAENIDEQRRHFISLSQEVIQMRKAFGGSEIYVQYCPMANNDQGAYWLSNAKEIRNPYYGDMMLTCGEVKETLSSK